ncbi:uncharacterized protein BDV17DRAFT_138047 [Aspergillus undulatus]|uniref:uncharacterized protein n=1 Tax=Aspergillus undulatus TaxID=1810928 RepID=UPI003CCD3A52
MSPGLEKRSLRPVISIELSIHFSNIRFHSLTESTLTSYYQRYTYHLRKSFPTPQIMSKPWLLYAYPWQPFPRRLVIYLRERNIPSSTVTLVHVSDVQFGDKPPVGFPPKPPGSLPVLAIPKPPSSGREEFIFIKQSIAIMEFLEEACITGRYGFPRLPQPLTLPINVPGADDITDITRTSNSDDANAISRALISARHSELLSLASGLTESWNSIRTFGSGAGTMRIPTAAKEMLGWTHRNLLAIENWFDEHGYSSASLKWDGNDKGNDNDDNDNCCHHGRQATIAEIVLFQFFEFTKDCYGIDMTQSSGKKVIDVYGREVVESYPRLERFYEDFSTRPSAKRHAELGDVPHERWAKKMTDWSEGIFEDK